MNIIFRNCNGDSKVDSSADDNVSRERVNVAALRNVFYSSMVSTDREKRLSVIEEPSPVGAQNNNGARFFSSSDEGCKPGNTEENVSS